MGDWWSYRPADFLLFSEDVYWRLFELANAALWPWPLAVLALGGAVPVLAWRWPVLAGRLIAAILAAALVGAAWGFLWVQYRPVNWAAGYAAALLALEALGLVWLGFVRGGLRFRTGAAAGIGWALYGYGLVLHPLTALVAGRPLRGAEFFGVAPDPTAIAVLGLLLTVTPGSGRAWLVPVPVLWCLASAATLLTLGTWEGWLVLGAAGAASLAVMWSGRAAPDGA